MIEQYLLYLAIKKIISNNCNYNITYNDMSLDAGEQSGVYINGALPNKRELSTGSYINNVDRVQILLTSSNNSESRLALFDNISNINKDMSNNPMIINVSLSNEDAAIFNTDHINYSVTITSCKFLSNFINLGINKLGLGMYSINIVVEYNVKEM